MDRRAVADFGMPSLLLMENAGRAVAERALARLAATGTRASRVCILCGRGNNGGDGFVAARHLRNAGVEVECILAGDAAGIKGDARTNFDLLEKLSIPIHAFAEGARIKADLIVDALLGTGFQGSPREPVAGAIRAANDSGIPILAVDLPSGLNADSGTAAGCCVRAAETVTFGLPKVGLAGSPGRDYAGEITVARISLPYPLLEDAALQAEWVTAERAAPFWTHRASDAHKGDSGRLFVLAGSVGLTGAATLACEAALRAGAGLVTLGIPASLNDLMEVKLTEAMTLPLPDTESRAHSPESLALVRKRLEAGGALAAGPGFGRDPLSGELLRNLLRDCSVPVVVDADGLTLLSPADERTFPAQCVVTPHPGEMARLLGTTTAQVQSNRMEAARSAAARFGCVVVLKGPATLIAAPDGRLAINSSGSAALATGGTGDVLTGVVAACLARGIAPYEAALAAVFLHGLAGEVAGERLGAPGTIAGDVVAAIPEAVRRLQTGEVPLPYRIV